MSDPEISAAERRAVSELARRVRPYVLDMEPEEVEGFAWRLAEAFLAWLRADQGWRPPLGPPPGWKVPAGRIAHDPPKAYRDARAALLRHDPDELEADADHGAAAASGEQG